MAATQTLVIDRASQLGIPLATTTGEETLDVTLVRPTKSLTARFGAVRRNAIQSVGTTPATLLMDTVMGGALGTAGNTSSTSKVTIAEAGVYLVCVRTTLGYSGSTGTLQLRLNGTTVATCTTVVVGSSNTINGLYLPMRLAAGDILTFWGQSSATRDFGSVPGVAGSQSSLHCYWIGL